MTSWIVVWVSQRWYMSIEISCNDGLGESYFLKWQFNFWWWWAVNIIHYKFFISEPDCDLLDVYVLNWRVLHCGLNVYPDQGHNSLELITFTFIGDEIWRNWNVIFKKHCLPKHRLELASDDRDIQAPTKLDMFFLYFGTGIVNWEFLLQHFQVRYDFSHCQLHSEFEKLSPLILVTIGEGVLFEKVDILSKRTTHLLAWSKSIQVLLFFAIKPAWPPPDYETIWPQPFYFCDFLPKSTYIDKKSGFLSTEVICRKKESLGPKNTWEEKSARKMFWPKI